MYGTNMSMTCHFTSNSATQYLFVYLRDVQFFISNPIENLNKNASIGFCAIGICFDGHIRRGLEHKKKLIRREMNVTKF